MKAAWYERKGPVREVLTVGERPTPEPAAGEVRVRIHRSAVNPSDTKQRGGHRGNVVMPFPFVIPHQDGAGIIDAGTLRLQRRAFVHLGGCGGRCGL